MKIAINLMGASSNRYGTNLTRGIEMLKGIDGRWSIQQKGRYLGPGEWYLEQAVIEAVDRCATSAPTSRGA